MKFSQMNVRAPRALQRPAVSRARQCVRARAEDAEKNPLEKAGDAIKETGQKFADAQKMPDLGEEANELTKDGAFYTATNKNKLEEDKTARATPTDDASPDVPFAETDSKGTGKGSDSTKPEVADNVDKAVK